MTFIQVDPWTYPQGFVPEFEQVTVVEQSDSETKTVLGATFVAIAPPMATTNAVAMIAIFLFMFKILIINDK
jgi:hypothetical protein